MQSKKISSQKGKRLLTDDCCLNFVKLTNQATCSVKPNLVYFGYEYIFLYPRFGHSLVMANIDRFDKNFHRYTTVPLKSAFFNPTELFNEHAQGMESVARGMAFMAMQGMDRKMTSMLTNHLFEDTKSREGTPPMVMVWLFID